jgi:hypothetical protein
MIPKIAHFHWSGPTMSWLRIVSIATFKKHNPDWEIRLHDTLPSIKKVGLNYPQQADWTWWEVLLEHGGFQVATDIVFIKPIPDEWLEKPLCAALNGGKEIYQFAALGAAPGLPFMHEVVRRCRQIGEKVRGQLDFQAFGVHLLHEVDLPEDMFDQPMAAFCPYDHIQCEKYWNGGELLPLPDETIGLHWYGGHEVTKRHERSAKYGGSTVIEQFATREMQ